MIAPLELGLASVDDLTIRDNLDVFTQNGFGFIEDAETGKMKLSSVPFSKATTFGIDDVIEMVGSFSYALMSLPFHLTCLNTLMILPADWDDSQWRDHQGVCRRKAEDYCCHEVHSPPKQGPSDVGDASMQKLDNGWHSPQFSANADDRVTPSSARWTMELSTWSAHITACLHYARICIIVLSNAFLRQSD